MSKRKREIKRCELVVRRDGGPQPWTCLLCGGSGLEYGEVKHKVTCAFTHNCVVGVRIERISGGIVFRMQKEGYWAWTSPGSEREYCIEKMPGCYVMTDENVKEIKTTRKLLELRLWVGLNQGVL